MTRDEIYKEIEDTLGIVPTSLKKVPDAFLQLEWETWKVSMTQEGAIPDKWRELICLAMEAVNGDERGVFYRTETARMYGATDEEIDEVAYLSKLINGWGPYLRAIQLDMEDFKEETYEMLEYVKAKHELGRRQTGEEAA